MDMSSENSPNRLARRPGEQGARPSAVNQAEVEKFDSGFRQSKRSRTSSDDTNRISHENLAKTWPKFLVVTGCDDGFSRLSAITICRYLKETVGFIESTRRLRNSSLLVQVDHRDQSLKLLGLKAFAGAPVKVEPHRFFNSCKGVVTSHESSLCSDDELRDWLDDYNVIHIHRQPPRYSRQTLTLTFDGTVLPDKVSIGFEWCRVRPYIPNPKRCYNCQRFGHFSGACRSKATCANCGSREHTHSRDSPCKNKSHCVNCGGDGPAYHRGCPKWQLEKEVLKLKTTKDISFPQARRIAEQEAGASYASVLSQTAGPSSPSPRTSPRRRINLDPNFNYTKAGQSSQKVDLPSKADHMATLKQYATDVGKGHLVTSLVVASQLSVPSQRATSEKESENHQPMEEEAATNTTPIPQRERERDKPSMVPKPTLNGRKGLNRSSVLGPAKTPSKNGGALKTTLTPKEAASLKRK
jgi:hypothetical protein